MSAMFLYWSRKLGSYLPKNHYLLNSYHKMQKHLVKLSYLAKKNEGLSPYSVLLLILDTEIANRRLL